MQIEPEAPDSPVREQAVSGAAFGLRLEVDPTIEIPGIAQLDARDARDSRPATSVRRDPRELTRRWSGAEHAAERVRELGDGDAVLLTIDFAPDAGYLLHAPGFGRILIAPDGTELICAPEAGSSEWTALLPAQALPLAATLRGFEVLHASGVVLRGRAALFTGPAGAGKSSLAAALLQHGATLLSDDTVALEQCGPELLAHPGAALLQLRDAEHDRLSTFERTALGPAARVLGKQRYNPSLAASPATFGELFLLERSTHGPLVERIEAVDPFALLASTFNLSVRAPERLVRHLDLAVALAATGRIYRLRVRPDMNATQLADNLVEHTLEL